MFKTFLAALALAALSGATVAQPAVGAPQERSAAELAADLTQPPSLQRTCVRKTCCYWTNGGRFLACVPA